MAKTKDKETPLMKQYYQVKQRHPGAMLLFRVGDFYETFGDDAIKASDILKITLTKRANGSASEVALAGFPHHALDNYLPKLVRSGQRVAICDQLENPKDVKGIVKRGVTELVTPGVSFNDNVLDVNRNNYLAAVCFDKKQAGVSFLDISTGEFIAAEGSISYIDKLMQSFRPAEVIFSKKSRDTFEQHFGQEYNTYYLDDWIFTLDYGYERLTRHFATAHLKGFGIEEQYLGIVAAGAVLFYLEETEHREVSHVSSISRIEEENYVWLDKFTIRNLELVYPQHESGVPLIQVLDKTLTPMGGRLMRKWMVLPLKDEKAINHRLEIVTGLKEDATLREELRQHLRQIGDLERLISKVAARRVNPREMNQLRRSMENIPPLKKLLGDASMAGLRASLGR